jgi:hypothetical protein
VTVVPAAALRPETATTVAYPFRGAIHWQVLLCDFSDSAAVAKTYGSSPQPRHDTKYYEDLFFTAGTHGLQDYVKALSQSSAFVSGAVHGWFHESSTWNAERAKGRGAHVDDCLKAAAAQGYTPPADDRIYVVTSPGVDIGGFESQGAIGQDWAPVFYDNNTKYWIRRETAFPEIAHEFGHGIGLGHSFSNDLAWLPASYGADGEYDNQFDLMSAANIFTNSKDAFGGSPPFLDAHHLEEMGWLPMSRVLDVGGEGLNARTVTLAALTHPEASGYLAIRVLFDPNDRFHYYTVEFRKADGWDSGWANVTVKPCSGSDAATTAGCKTDKKLSVTYPNAMIMINEVQKNDVHRTGSASAPAPYQNGSYYSVLLRQLGAFAGSGDGAPDQSLKANGVTIAVEKVSGDQATVKITTTYKPKCASGYVQRDAGAGDAVCVLPDERAATLAENAAAASHHAGHGDDCKAGYVKRDAYEGDAVCVTPAQRDAAHAQDAAAAEHVKFNEYGPLTCKEGYVWRQADDRDYVCVSPAIRQRIATENAAAEKNRSGDKCRAGLVFRGAYPGDEVCVSPASRTEAETDNAAAAQRIQQPAS